MNRQQKDSKIIVIMGVSGSGKTTVGKRIAQLLDLPFYDGDDFHSLENVSKMKNGIPLTDEDRGPWLSTLADLIEQHEKRGMILACSALKHRYRTLLDRNSNVFFVHLKGSYETIQKRIAERNSHFMPATLLQSQFNNLESPEDAVEIDIEETLDTIINQVMRVIR